jgi:HEAT repeat protein
LIAISGLARRDEPEALAALGAAVRDPEPGVGEAALSLLGERTDRAAAEALVTAALASEPEHPAQRALSRPGAERVAAIQARLRASGITGPTERDAAVLVAALARMADAAALAALFDGLSRPNPAVRRFAATALIATDAPEARRRVAELAIHDPDPDVRRALAAAVA